MALRELVIVLILLSIPLTPWAQRINYESGWNPGVLVLKNSSVVKGQINYIQKKESVAVITEDQKSAYPAAAIRYFQFFDKKLGYNRAFTTMNRNPDTTTPSMQIFEIVLEGTLPYYRKPILVEKTVVRHNKAVSNHITDDFVEYIYFLKTEDSLVEVKNFGHDALPHLKKHIKEISRFIRKNKLDHTLASDQIQIIDRYNALEETAIKKGIN